MIAAQARSVENAEHAEIAEHAESSNTSTIRFRVFSFFRVFRVLVVFLQLLFTGLAQAQTDVPARLSLADAVAQARQQHPLIIAARQRVAMAEGEQLDAGLRLNPSPVTFAWIFFRAQNFDQAMQVIHKLGDLDFNLNLTQLCAEKGPLNLALSLLVIGLLILSYRLPRELKLRHNVAFVAVVTFLIIIFGKNGSADFIYFQF